MDTVTSHFEILKNSRTRISWTISVLDPCTRECLALEVDTHMGSGKVKRVPEFTSRHFLPWCLERKIEVVHIETGKPVRNPRVEVFHVPLFPSA